MDRETFEHRLDAWRELYDKAKKQLDHALVDVTIRQNSVERMERVASRFRLERNVVLVIWIITVIALLCAV